MDTKALRQKILDLAIRGKLVPQDSNDEPASILLEHIRQQKQQMVKDGKLKAKDIKNDTVIFVGEDNLHYEKFQDGSVKYIEDESPFELPEGWAWARLGNITDITTGRLDANAQVEDGVYPFFTCGEEVLQTDTFAFDCDAVLLGGNNAVGDFKMHRFSGKFNAYQRVYVITAYALLDTDYIYNHIQYYLPMLKEMSIGSQTRYLKLGMVTELLISIPPLNTQKFLSNKIKELLNYCDEIEANKSSLNDLLINTKSKILDLAIRGQLVPQDPNDEPASVLLERIRAEKEELIKQGKLKRDKKESVIFKGEDNSYYLKTGELVESLEDWAFEELPDSWSVCCLGELCDYGNCTNVNTTDIADSAWILDLEDIEKDSGVILQKVRQDERNAGSTKHRFHKGQVLYSKLRPYLNKVVLADEDGYCTSEILPLEFERNIHPQYARYFLMSQTFLRYANKCSYGVKMPRLGTADGKKAIISVPPVKEQKRIVMAIELAFAQLASITENLT